MSRHDRIDLELDGLGVENTDERGWRFAPHGWVVARATPNLALDTSRRSAHELRNGAPAIASREPPQRRFIRAAQSAIRVHPC
jgi:hypothetical protein